MSKSTLTATAELVRVETIEGANSANRIGQLLKDMISQMIVNSENQSINIVITHLQSPVIPKASASTHAQNQGGVEDQIEARITQSTGQSVKLVMSQKALTDELVSVKERADVVLCASEAFAQESYQSAVAANKSKVESEEAAAAAFQKELEASEHAVDAQAAKTGAQTAQGLTEQAKIASEAARNLAVAANNAAQLAKTAAELAWDNFDDTYLGAKATDPTVDNDGGVLNVGAMYFNSTSKIFKVWDGSAWVTHPALESARSQSTTKAPTSKLLDDELTELSADYDPSVHLTKSIDVTSGVAVNSTNGFLDIDLKTGETATFGFYDANGVIGSGTFFLYVRRASNNSWGAPIAISKNASTQYTATYDINGYYVGISAGSVTGSGPIEIRYDQTKPLVVSIITEKATAIVESYDVIQKGDALVNLNETFGLTDHARVYNNVASIIVGGDNSKPRYARNIFNYISELPSLSVVSDSFLVSEGLSTIDTKGLSGAIGANLKFNKNIYSDDGDLFSKIIAGNGKRFRLEVYVYSKYHDFPAVGATSKVYSSGLLVNANLSSVQDTDSPEVKKLVFSGVNNANSGITYILIDINNTATSEYQIGDYGLTGWKIGLFDSVSDESTKELIGDWELEKMESPFGTQEAHSQEYVDFISNASTDGLNGYSFNHVEDTKKRISLYTKRYNNKFVDQYNRLLVSFNGDSIIGSQLDDITKSDGYLTGDFPPNMSKMIMARQFFDRYKFAGEDTQFRNLIHSDWTKVGFNVSNGKDDSAQTFNEIEVYGGASGDYAQITVTGFKYLKIVWSEYKGLSYSFDIMRSTDGGSTFTTVETINVTSARKLMVAYKIYEITQSTNYIYKIVPTSGYSNVCFWGIEMWNNPRLDVVVEAFSGSTAAENILDKLDGFYSEFHKPALIIIDIFAINDYAVSNNLNDWIYNLTQLYSFIKSKSIPVIAFGTHYNSSFVKMSCELTTLQDIPIIDILAKIANPQTAPIGSIQNATDGIHLSNYGNSYYFEELKKIFN